MDALCDWALCAGDEEQRNWLLEVARQTDNGSQGWRDRALDPAAWHDVRALAELARTAPVADESVSVVLSLGQRLWGMGGDAAMFLRHVQAANPAYFWANLIAGKALVYTSSHEAERNAGGEADDLAGGPRAGRTARAEIPRIIASRRARGMPHGLE